MTATIIWIFRRIANVSFDEVSQFAHFFAAYASVMTGGFLYGHTGVWVSGAQMIAFAAIKEGWFDPKYETPDIAGNGWVDFGFYFLGVAAATGVFYLRG
jgi:hypothetical protein